MQEYENIFKNKKPIINKLLNYGFVYINEQYIYQTSINNHHFNLKVIIDQDNKVDTELLDTDTNEIYILHKIAKANGNYVNQIKKAYMNVLLDIVDHCFEFNVFKSKQANEIIQYVRRKYNNELQFLWKNSNNAVLKRIDNQKWYAVFLVIAKDKLGFPKKDLIEIIDLRINPEELPTLIDNQKYFPGYHMNKRNWLTICLDGSVDIEEIKARLDTSYLIANKRK